MQSYSGGYNGGNSSLLQGFPLSRHLWTTQFTEHLVHLPGPISSTASTLLSSDLATAMEINPIMFTLQTNT